MVSHKSENLLGLEIFERLVADDSQIKPVNHEQVENLVEIFVVGFVSRLSFFLESDLRTAFGEIIVEQQFLPRRLLPVIFIFGESAQQILELNALQPRFGNKP